MKFHTEGMPFIAGSAIFAVLAYIIAPAFGLLVSGFALFVAYFFRDPERILPDSVNLEDAVISPSDGIVIGVSEDTKDDEKFTRISIFLNVFDVHVTRIPYSGKVTKRSYQKGSFAHAETDKAFHRNENLALTIEGKEKVIVRQVAGLIARRIVCYAENGDQVKVGDRYGIIKFGSRMDLFLPLKSQVLVKKGQTMIGGETVLAIIK